jgi:hypothetical protein
MVSAAVAHLPTAVSLLLLAALFMQISGVSSTLTWPRRLCLLRVLLCLSCCYKFSQHIGGGDTAPAFSGLCVYLQFTWEVGLPRSLVEFSSHRQFYNLSRSWLLGMCRCSCLLWLACEGFPLPPLQHSGHPALFATCLFCHYCLLFSFFFLFSLGGVGLSRGLC